MKKLSLVLAFLFLSLCAFAESAGQLATYTYNLEQGWNLIGLTLNPTAESEQEMLGHRIYEFNGDRTVKAYCQSGDLAAGRAYWIFSDQNESLVVRGTPVGDIQPGDPGTTGEYKLAIGDITSETSGEEVTVTAPTKEGYSFTEWTVEGVSIADRSQETLSFTMPTNNVMLEPNYTINSYTLTVDGTEEQVNYGASVEKTAATKEGHTFTGWTLEGVTVDDPTAATISFTMPANAVTLKTNYEEAQEGGTYLVVNLSDGSYSYTETAPDLTSDTCRTTELWLRKIPAGTFTMGSPADEVGRVDNETQHQVTLTEGFYIGVFEMTQRQYELITGQRPSFFNNDSCYATRPVEQVSYDMIRGTTANLGAGWPTYGHAVDSDSFLGKLRTKTGLAFDLPTEAQWEYACRAGTTTALNTGKNLAATGQDAAMDEAGRYWYNGGSGYSQSCDATAGTAKVGSYLPNAWGLYDMHGNVWEWCLDRYGSYSGDATDPKGATSGSPRVERGGGWDYSARDCRSANRGSYDPSGSISDIYGFRVAIMPSVQ